MKSFLDENFLLQTKTAEKLYHEYAVHMPIIDYHNHLPPDQIQSNLKFSNISHAWLHGDHYKWRAMRTNAVSEEYCTGSASDIEKFRKWAATVPYTMRNPLYHWTHLELKGYFGIKETLNAANADSIYEKTTERLQQESHSTRGLLKMMNVTTVCTTDDPLDSLEYHKAYAEEISGKEHEVNMFPAFRPDKFILIHHAGFKTFVGKLSELVGFEIKDLEDLKNALKQRAHFFQKNSCKISDHGLEYIPNLTATDEEAEAILKRALAGNFISLQESEKFQVNMLRFLCKMYHDLSWVQQFHLGAMRNNNLRALRELGPDTGWDSIGDYNQAQGLSKLLGSLDEHNHLAKTIIYNLNPSDNEVMASMLGNFNDGSTLAKIQWGSGWWFLDQKDGMEKQLNTLSNLGLLSRFVGMLTDSRSFLSFPRHEYFRRILCNLYGKDIENGELPSDLDFIGRTIQDICYNNSKNYFGFTK
jgi:glucuronate isomerase